jgi:HSP20 family protein
MFYNRLNREYPVQARRQYGREYFRPMNRFMSDDQRWTTRLEQELHTAQPHTDILELDDQFILEIALPGVVLDDVELKLEDNILTVIAKRTPNMFEERAHLLHKEMPCGYFVRHFEFETEVLIEHIEARLDRGILFVSIPKVEQAIRIPVSHGSLESHLPGMKTRVTGKNEQLRSNKELSVK